MLKQSPTAGRKEGELKGAMVVCPTSLVMNWAKEVAHALHTRAHAHAARARERARDGAACRRLSAPERPDA
eukprot:856991-Prymnesium_polylepis.1